MTALQDLPADLLGTILAYACEGAWLHYLVPRLAGQHLLVCKRFRKAIEGTSFWQGVSLVMSSTAFFHPLHAAFVTRLSSAAGYTPEVTPQGFTQAG